jgi:drug/metabolite transporter (DMT)-like permease
VALLGGLAAAAFFATATICSSRSSRLISPASVLAWVMLVGLIAVVPAIAVVGPTSRVSAADTGWLLLSGAGNVVGLLLAYSALRLGKVGVVAPIVSTEGAIAAIASVVSGESLQTGAALLLPVIALGVALAASGPSTDISPGGAAASGSRWRQPVMLACAAATAFGTSLYATGQASAALPVPWVLLPARVIGVLVIALPLLVRGQLQLTRRAVPFVVIGGLCEVLGFAAFALGSRHGLAVAAVLSSQFAALAAVAAFVIFRERLTRLQVSGVSLLAIGVAALSAIRA